jgi:hypothetical protein
MSSSLKTSVPATDNGYYGIISLSDNHQLFHSALTGVGYDGIPRDNATLYVYDPQLLAQDEITVYLQIVSEGGDTITLSTAAGSMPYTAAAGNSWIQAVITVPKDTTKLPISIDSLNGTASIQTYMVK